MKVSEVARRAGVAPSAIRFYEAEGVLPPPARSPSGYRQYGEADVCRLRTLATLRSLGIDLQEAGRLAGTCAEGRCDEMAVDLLPRIQERRAEVARARAELDHLEARLGQMEQALRAGASNAGLCTGPEGCGAEKGLSDDSAGCAPGCCGGL